MFRYRPVVVKVNQSFGELVLDKVFDKAADKVAEVIVALPVLILKAVASSKVRVIIQDKDTPSEEE